MLRASKIHPSDVPGRCILFPQNTSDPEGFIYGETLAGPFATDIRPTISIRGLREAAQRYAGMVTAEDVESLRQELVDLQVEVEQCRQELAEYDRRFTAIDVLESADYTARKKPGRPKQVA
jgi:hypothetical protein